MHHFLQQRPTPRTKRATMLALGGILCAFIFYSSAVRDGHDWGGDHAQYILHAQTLLQGANYAPPPGFVYNPYLMWAPLSYPPLYPIFIGGVLALFGLNFIALKIQIVILLSLGLYAYWRFARNNLPVNVALGALAFLIFSPYLLKFSNKILSDIPYLSLSLYAILAGERFFKPKSSVWDALVFSFLLISAICMRNVGFSLILAVPLYALFFRRGHLIRALIISGITFAAVSIISWKMLEFFLDQSSPSPTRILLWFAGNLWHHFPYQLSRWLALYPRTGSTTALIFNTPVLVLYLGLCVVGVVHVIRARGVKYWDVYAAVYAATILSYAWVVSRYLIPLVPLLSIYAFSGLRVVALLIRKAIRLPFRKSYLLKTIYRYRFLFPALLYIPLFSVYWTHYALQPATQGANVLKDPTVRDLFEAVQNLDISGAVFDRPRVLTLFTKVPGTLCHNKRGYYWHQKVTWDLAMLLDLASQGNISHIILDRAKSATWIAISPIVSQHPQHFRLSYSNMGYDIYQILR